MSLRYVDTNGILNVCTVWLHQAVSVRQLYTQGATMKLEPLSDEEIKEQYLGWEQALRHAVDELDERVATDALRLILTIAHERAVAAKEEHFSRTGGYERITQGRFWTHEDYLHAELLALGWPEKELI